MTEVYQPGDIVKPEGIDTLAEVVCQRGRWLWIASAADDCDDDDAPRPFMVRVRDVRFVGRLNRYGISYLIDFI